MGKQSIAIGKELREAIGRAVGGLMIEIHANVTEGTPRDTGWAAANWLANIGGPAFAVATPSSRDIRSASAAGRASAASSSLAPLLSYKLGDGPIFVSNGVPYIEELNQGSSQKAPAGFVQTGIIQALNTFSRT